MARKTSRLAVWIILGLLIVGLMGFGAGGFSSTQRTVATVGDKAVSVQDYGNTLQGQIRALGQRSGQQISIEQARAIGLDQQVLRELITTRALEHEAAQLGLSVGDEQLRNRIMQIPAFQGIDGKFDREAYRFALERTGQSEAQFEAGLRDDAARGLLQGAVLGALQMPDSFTDTLMSYLGERRDITWARLTQSSLPEPLGEPDADTLTAYYEANPQNFTLPERKKLTYAVLSPNSLIDQIEVSEDSLQNAYTLREDEFIRPERRLVERLVFPDMASAETAKAQIEIDAITFEQAVTARDLTLADVDLGDVTADELDAGGEAVFALQEPGVVGPIETDLGPALFRMNAILQATEVSFEDARDGLRSELAADAARRQVVELGEEVNDLLAGGATLEELAEQTSMTLGTLEWYPDFAEDLARYDTIRTAAAEITQDDFPELLTLSDGSIAALRMDETLSPKLRPQDEVAEAVRAGWEAEETRNRLADMATTALPKLREGVEFAEAGLPAETRQDMTRRDQVVGAPADFQEVIFDMEPGELREVPALGAHFVVRLDAVKPADTTDPQFLAIRDALRAQANQSLTEDLLQIYANDVQSRAGVELDQAAINAVNSQLQ